MTTTSHTRSNVMTTIPKITVSFDGVDDAETATSIETQLASGEITLDDLNPLNDKIVHTLIDSMGDPT